MATGIQLKDMAILLRWFKNNSFYKRLEVEIGRRKLLGHQPILYDIKFHNRIMSSRTVKYILAVFGYFLLSRENINREVLQDHIKRVT